MDPGHRSAPDSVWGDLWGNLPGLGFLACEIGTIFPAPLAGLQVSGMTYGGVKARRQARAKMATRGRERLLLDRDPADPIPPWAGASGPDRQAEAPLGPGLLFWEGHVASLL